MSRKCLQMGLLTLLVLFQLFGVEKAYANEHKLESLHIHVFINEDGSATITEQRVANLVEGTENYIVIGNLGKSEIKDFTVWENGEAYEYVDNWNIDASRQEKAFKNGIIETKDGYELSWGIGEYGRHEYTLEYTVTHFIKQLEDSQILFWRFVNDQMNIPPEKVTVEIESKHPFSDETERIWAFGYTGEIQFEEGKIIASSSNPLDQNNYVTILVKLADGMFATEDVINQPFEEIRDKAMEGSDYGKDTSGEGFELTDRGVNTVITIFALIFIFSRLFRRSDKITGQRPKKFKRKYQGDYYRDYPYEERFVDSYYIPYIMGASKFENLLTGFILKWVHEGKVMVETEQVGLIFKRDAATIKFLKRIEVENRSSVEGQLFEMMESAAGINGILEQNEFTKWAGVHHKKLKGWEQRVINLSLKKLQELGYIQLHEKGKFIFKRREYVLTEKGRELEANIYKYVNYLHDFSLLNEHEAVNVKIWDHIMIWAAFLGLTDVVEKQFKTLYPKYEQETAYSRGSLRSTNALSRRVSSARTPSRSSGGGGRSSSGGGGGGSFGGGSGGGTR